MSKKILFSMFIVIFADMLGIGIISPLLSIFSREYGVSGLWLGIIYSSLSISRFFAMPIAVPMADKFGKKKFMCIGLFVYAILALAFIGVNFIDKSYAAYYLTAIRFLRGLASVMVVPVARAYFGELSPKNQEGRYMGLFNIAFFAGTGAGPLIGGFVKDVLNFEAVFGIMSALCALGFIVALLFIPERKGNVINLREHLAIRNITRLLNHKMMRAQFVLIAILSVASSSALVYIPIFADEVLKVSTFKVGVVVAAAEILAGLLQGFTGRLADKYSKMILIMCGSFFAAVFYFVLPYSASFGMLLVFRVLMSFGPAVSMPANAAIVTRIGKKYGMSHAMSLFNMAQTLGHLLSPIILGLVFDNIVGAQTPIIGQTNATAAALTWVFRISGMLGVSGVFIYWLMARKYKEETESDPKPSSQPS